MRVYVVGYAPANDGAATGGFDWFPSPGEAVARGRRDLREIGVLGNHSVTYVPLDVPNDVAYPDGQTVADRDAVTSWIDANLHLVEVGLPPESDADVEVVLPDGEEGRISLSGEPLSTAAREAVESLLAPTCIIYGCGEPADNEGPIQFALPGGGGEERSLLDGLVCATHREILTANTLRGVSMAEPPEGPRQTRPSAILRRPAPETPVSDLTTAELLYEARERMEVRPRTFALGSPLDPSEDFERREEDLARARQATEDAISLHNRAVYRERGIFALTDAERTPTDG